MDKDIPRRLKIKKENNPMEYEVKEKSSELAIKEIDLFKDSKELEKHIGEKESFVMEKRIVSIKLNGYQTDTPYGKKAKSVEIAILISITPKQILEDILKNIQKTFNINDMETASFPFVAFDAIRDVKENENDFLFIDISGEVTDVSLIHSDVLLDTVSFPIGKKTIIRRLSKELKTKKDDALSTLKIYVDNGFSSSKSKRAEDMVSRVGDEWLAVFTKTLEDLSGNISIPQKVYITSDEDLQDWFVSLIEKEKFGQYTMSAQGFEVNKLNSEFLKDL